MNRSLILLRFFLRIFMHNYKAFMSGVIYLHLTFTDCMSNQYKRFEMSTFQMCMQFIEGIL